MTLNEFIEVLKKLQKEGKGEHQVVVKFRDDGGDIPGWDEDVTPVVNEVRKLIFL